MFISLSQYLLTITFILFSVTKSAPIMKSRDTAELYIFANCINNSTTPYTKYAAIFWYYPDFLPDYPEPQLTAIISNTSNVNYAGKTTSVTTPFSLTSTDAKSSSFAGPMAVFKGTGDIFYTPETDINCVWEYYQQDVRLTLKYGPFALC